VDPNDPTKIIEKKIHKEEYEGQDLWKGKSLLSIVWIMANNMQIWSLLRSEDLLRRSKLLGIKWKPRSLNDH
jgi:hypothetical protein